MRREHRVVDQGAHRSAQGLLRTRQWRLQRHPGRHCSRIVCVSLSNASPDFSVSCNDFPRRFTMNFTMTLREKHMPTKTTQTFDPADGSTPVTLPTSDPCCQSPCDPPWRAGPSCTTFTETKTSTVTLVNDSKTADFARGFVTINVTYAHTLCLIGKQHGGLAYTLTLLPGEKTTLYQSDRYRRTTSETARYSVQTTFAQFVSALYQQQNSSDSSLLVQVLNNQAQSSGSAGGGFNPFTLSIGGGSSSSSLSSSSAGDLSTQSSANQFLSLAQQYTDLQRSIT